MEGNSLLPMCQAGVEFEDGKKISDSRMVDATHCLDYLRGFLDGFTMGQLAPGATEVLCFPEGVNAGQMVRVVAKWFQDHPARLHEPAYGLVFTALRDAFSCQSTSGQGVAPPLVSPGSPGDRKPTTENDNNGQESSVQPSVSIDSLESLRNAQINADNNKALSSAEEAVRLKPTDGYAWYSLGKAYIDLGDYKSAEEPLKTALKAFLSAPPDLTLPSNAQPSRTMASTTSFFLAEVCDKLHKKHEAARYRRGALMLMSTR